MSAITKHTDVVNRMKDRDANTVVQIVLLAQGRSDRGRDAGLRLYFCGLVAR